MLQGVMARLTSEKKCPKRSPHVTPAYSRNCRQSGAVSKCICEIFRRGIRRRTTLSSLTQMSSQKVEHIRAHSSHVNILTLSLIQIHRHASRFSPYGAVGGGVEALFLTQTFPPPLDVCVAHSKLCLAFDLSRRMVLLPAALLPTPTYGV